MFLFKNKTPKNITFNGKPVKELIFNGVSVWVGKILALVTGIPPLELTSSTGEDLVDYKVYGETVQNGTPAPDAPVEMECVGDYDEETGKYKIPIRVSSKNLVDYTALKITPNNIKAATYEDGVYIGTGSVGSGATGFSAGQLWMIFEKEFEANKTYTLSIPITLLEQGVYDNRIMLMLGKGDVSYSRHTKTIYLPLQEEAVYTLTITPTINIDRITIRFNNNKLKIDIGRLMFEESAEATEFEPYFEPVTTNIHLDEPLRKVVKTDWSDYIDFKNKKVVRKIRERVFNGTEYIVSYLNSTYSFGIYTGETDMSHLASEKRLNADRLKAVSANTLYMVREKEGYNYVSTWGGDAVVVMINNYTTVEEVKAWLKENPLTVQYIYTTPKEEDIELPSILLNEGTNIISIDTTIQPSNVEIEYYKTSE